MADPKIRLKRSSVEGKIPTPDQVPLGEIALNTYDGYLYASKNVGIGTTVVAINPFRVGTGTNTYNAYFTAGNVGIGSEIPTTKLDVDGTVTATSFVKSGGTASQYLMADGSVSTGGGGDSATLGGISSTGYLRSDVADTKSSGNLTFSDNVSIILGDGSDTTINHNGTDTTIVHRTGDFKIQTIAGDFTGDDIILNAADDVDIQVGGGTTAIYATGGGSVKLNHNGSTKLETTSSGANVTGTVSATDVSVAGGHIILNNSGASVIGVTTSTSFVKSSNSGGFLKADGTEDTSTYLTSYTETDPVVAAINGIVKSDGTTISAATAGTDYLTPSGDGSGLSGIVTGIQAGTNITVLESPAGNFIITSTSSGGGSSLWTQTGYTGIGTTSAVGIGTIIEVIPYDTQNNGTLSFEGSAGQLFSITNQLSSGSIFSVNDISGIPSIDVDADGTIQLAPVGVGESVGIGTTNPKYKLHVVGTTNIDGTFTVNGAPVQTGSGVASTITVADESSDTTCFPLFSTDATGDINPKTGSNLTFNSSTGALTATSFSGDGSNLTGISTIGSRWITTGYTGIGTTSAVGIGTIIEVIPYDTQNNGTLSFEGSAGQLFSITNQLSSGSIFSVNDISGIPSIDVDADGTIQLAPVGAGESVGIGTTNPQYKLHVVGDTNIDGTFTVNGSPVSGGSGIASVAADTTPQLGGNLDLNSNDITGTGNLNITGIATFSGNVTIGGTLTYEDVTNIDSIGLITARSGINVSAGGINVTGVSTFQDHVHLGNDDVLNLGDNQDLRIFYNSNNGNSVIAEHGSGNLHINADDLQIKSTGSTEVKAKFITNGAVELYHDNSKKLETTGTGVSFTGNIENYNTLVGSASTTMVDFTVTVAAKSDHRYGGGSSNAYYLNGIESPFLTLTPGRTYNFKQDDNSNSSHPFRFYLEADKTTQYTEGVTSLGSPGSTGGMTSIEVTDETPVVLHYQCSSHDYMGNAVQVNSNKVNTPYQIDGLKGANITGVVTATSFVKSSNSGGFLKADGTEDTNTYLTSLGTAIVDGDFTSNGFMKRTGAGTYAVDSNTYLTTESDPVVGAINGIVKANGSGTISAATAGTDYLTPSGDGSSLTGLTGASAATYGSAGATPVIVVDSDGRITGISTVATSGSGGGGSVSEAFKTIAVSGQSDVVADGATDTLTLVAGSNMTITTNATGDSITFASSGGGGGGSSSVRTVNRYVATQSQTLFPPSGTVSYTVGYLDVYLNGSRLDTTEFTATNGTTVTLATGASANDIVELIAFTNVGITSVTVANDSTPQLGGDLDLNGNNITGTGNINITGTATVSGSQVATQNDAIAFAIALG